MDLLKIQGPQSISAIEEQYIQLHEQQSADVLLARNVESWRLGGKAALIQLIITWARRCSSASLRTHITGKDDSTLNTQLQNLVNKDHGLAALLMATNITSRDGAERLTSLAKNYSHDELSKMNAQIGAQRGAVKRGPKVILICADHTSAPVRHFYYPNGNIRAEGEFAELVAQLVERVTKRRERPTGAPLFEGAAQPELFTELGSIVYELFANTDEWATTDEKGVPLKRSIRGILVESHNDDIESYLAISKDSAPQKAYLKYNAESRGHGRRFLEISVFDSGPGLAARSYGPSWSEEVAWQDEFAACLRCLRKWRTSTSQSHRGVGLVRVMRNLTALRGFWRIRTGRLSLCRDFAQQPYTEDGNRTTTDTIDNPTLVDWYSGSANNLTPLARAEGVLITMLIPLSHQ